jgi:DNA replication protein DnaC
LLIYGGTGNGKTHCCNALAARLVQRGKPVKLWAVADLFARLRKSVGTNTLEDEIEILKGERFLILDDWAPEYASKFEIARMEEVVDYRYRQGLYTVLTTNRPLPELPDRIVSRFSEHPIGKRVQNSARDYRLKGGER